MHLNADGSVTSRWGRTGRRLTGIETRKVDMMALERSKIRKGYAYIGHADIDAQGYILQIDPVPSDEGSSERIPLPDVPIFAMEWRLTLGSTTTVTELEEWKQSVLRLFKEQQIDIPPESLPETRRSGKGQITRADGVHAFLALILMKSLTPPGVGFSIRTKEGTEVSLDLRKDSELLTELGIDLRTIRPLAEALHLVDPLLDLEQAIADEGQVWF